MPERSADWFAQAERDLESARRQLEGGFQEWACFASQQAAEKAIKGVYQKLGGDAWGHSVVQLLQGLADRIAEALADRWIDRPLEFYPYFRDSGIGVELFCYTASEAAENRLARRAMERGIRLAER